MSGHADASVEVWRKIINQLFRAHKTRTFPDNYSRRTEATKVHDVKHATAIEINEPMTKIQPLIMIDHQHYE
jgi:hypothetical protein